MLGSACFLAIDTECGAKPVPAVPFCKNFVALEKPIILPKGKTDSIYLRCAIRRLTAYHPRLGSIAAGKFESTIRFMNYSATVHNVLELGHGAAQLNTFIGKYDKCIRGLAMLCLFFRLSFWLTTMRGAKRYLVWPKRSPRSMFPMSRRTPFTISG
jgi:hypothetical protein